MKKKLYMDDNYIAGLSCEQLAGQRLMLGFNGTELNDDLKFLIKDLKAGGIILFSRNIVSQEQVKDLCHAVQAYAKEHDQPPLFIAIDQEGGVVSRLKEPFTQFPSGNPAMKNTDDALEFASITAKELSYIGVNMDMAPVMDVLPAGFNGIMDKRVFNGDANFVAKMGTAVISGLQQNKIMAVAKHFPGIGRTTLDSHLTLPELDMDYNEFLKTDLIPFEASVKNNVAGIMLSHIQYNFIDPDWPASLSIKIVKDLLRSKMKYNGLVMTDDLDMKAVTIDIKSSLKRIIEADVDIALICHKSGDIKTAYNELLSYTKASDENHMNCSNSVKRIMSLKTDYLSGTATA